MVNNRNISGSPARKEMAAWIEGYDAAKEFYEQVIRDLQEACLSDVQEITDRYDISNEER